MSFVSLFLFRCISFTFYPIIHILYQLYPFFEMLGRAKDAYFILFK